MSHVCNVVQELQWCDCSGVKAVMRPTGTTAARGPYQYQFRVAPEWLPEGVYLAAHVKSHSTNWWAVTRLVVRVRRAGDIKASDPRLESPENFQQLKDWAIMAANLTQG